MRLQLSRTLAAAAAAVVLPMAYAQEATPVPAAAPIHEVNSSAPVPQPPANLVEEPNASAFASENAAELERVKPIVDALNAEASLKASKISVVPDKDVITLVGVTLSDAQRKRAMEIASSQAGEAKVVNALTTQQLVINTPGA